jgi:hypothetical protein
MGGQRKMKKITNVLFIGIWILLLMMLSNQVSEAEIKEKNIINYPSTPEGVIEAFVRLDFDGTADELIGDMRKKLRFVTWEIPYGSDISYIISEYRIEKFREDSREATAKVTYTVIGTLGGFEDLEMEKRDKKVIFYDLLKQKGLWKISSPAHPPYISVKTAIKILEFGMTYYKDDSEKKGKIKRNIDILKKYF